MTITYAGIGSRETPNDVLSLMTRIGKFLSENNIILRSGHAGGADLAFETGCDIANKNNKEIWIPWRGFNNSNSSFIVAKPEAFKMASEIHPAWDKCSEGAKKLHARNMHQILGTDLKTPCNFVICYTKNGLLTGGTAQAIRLSEKYNIPVFNIGSFDSNPDIKAREYAIWDFIKRYI